MIGKHAAASPIRVLVYDLPEMLRAIVTKALETQPDIEVSESSVEATRLLAIVNGIRPDVIITAARPKESADAHAEMLEHNPRIRIFCLAPDGRASWKKELRLNTVGLGDISPNDLLGMIRECAGQPMAASGALDLVELVRH